MDVLRSNISNERVAAIPKDVKITHVLRKMGMSITYENIREEIRNLAKAGYAERLWAFRDKEGSYCFATSTYNIDRGQKLLQWIQRHLHSSVKVESYTISRAMQMDKTQWPRMNGGNVHRDFIFIVRTP